MYCLKTHLRLQQRKESHSSELSQTGRFRISFKYNKTFNILIYFTLFLLGLNKERYEIN